MLFSETNKSEWDLKNEINKVNVRWAIFLFTIPYLYVQFFLKSSSIDDHFKDITFQYVSAVSILSVVLNLFYNIFLIKRRNNQKLIHPSMKYVSMIFDLSIVTFLLPPTGGSESMFFLLYIVVLLSNGMRYGMRLAVVGILTFNAFYLAMLFVHYYPEMEISTLNHETIKVIGVWVVGLYIGYLARRFQMLSGDVEKYKKLLKKHLDSAGGGESS